MKKALITGGAGFIGSSLIDRLLKDNWNITTIDNFDTFYKREVKEGNIKEFISNPNFQLVEEDIRNFDALKTKLDGNYNIIVHLAAKAGVRPSIENPIAYQQANVQGTQNLLELAKQWAVKQFVFASSSSVYGINPNVPWCENDYVLQPISPYAATKVSGELLGHVYSKLYNIRFIALRFFTVYGPRQRPDLAIHKFTRLISEKKAIPVYGDGSTRRDYTYIDDIVTGIINAMNYKQSSYEIINIGNSNTVSLSEMIKVIEETLSIKAIIKRLPEQPGDVSQTFANVEKAKKLLNYNPSTDFRVGVESFIKWLGR